MSFLSVLAEDIYTSHKENLHDISVILPGKRASLFLHKELAERAKGAYLSPDITSFGEWIESHSPYSSIDPTLALCYLFPIYNRYFPNKETFDQFINWGKQLINDWNEIGRYMLDPSSVYQNLRNIQELENWTTEDWSFAQNPLSKRQESFVSLWDKMPEIRIAFLEAIKIDGFNLSGEIYRETALNIPEISNKLSDKELFIAGLNALSTSEKLILDQLIKQKKATVYWDVDRHYMNDPEHEAGYFLRQHYAQWKNSCVWVEGEWETSQKDIHIYEAPNEHSQAAVLNKILQKESTYTLVMPDDALLLPSLLEMPENVTHVNITKQWPLHQSPFYQFIIKILKIWEKGLLKNGIHHHGLSEICTLDALTFILSPQEKKDLNSFINHVNKKNIPFITRDLVTDKIPKHRVFELLFTPHTNTKEALKTLEKTLSNIQISEQHKLQKVLYEQLFQCKKILNKLLSFLQKNKLDIQLSTAIRLFDSFSADAQLNFIGEPLKGLQIIGVLETRSIDYENIIILNTNEGVLPAKSNSNSLIPYDLRRYFGLPLKKEKESIYAYYFYRLLSRAKIINLIYHNHSEGVSGGELSRYLLQLKLSYQEQKNLNIQFFKPNFKVNENTYPGEIKKSERIISLIKEFFKSGLSPSALNNFLECQENFYHNNLLRVHELTKNEELIEDSTYGNAVHKTLDNLYKKETETSPKIDLKSIERIRNRVAGELKKTFSENFEQRELSQSLISLKYKMALEAIHAFLNLEEKEINESQNQFIEIMALETTVNKALNFELSGEEIVFNLKGTIDRVDKLDGNIRILDYKTGKVKDSDLKLWELDTLLERNDKGKLIQLLFYSCLLKESYPSFYSGMCSLASLNPTWKFLHNEQGKISVDEKLSKAFEKLIVNWAKDLVNPNIPLYPTPLSERYSNRIKLIRES